MLLSPPETSGQSVRASGWTVIAWSRLGSTAASATIAEYGRN
jgi:hypothetical protein